MEGNFKKNKTQKNTIPKIYTLVLILAPWLSIYSTFIEGVNIADGLLIVTTILAFPKLLKNKNKKKASNFLMVFLLYCLISILLVILSGESIIVGRVLQRFGKTFFYFASVVLFRKLFNYEYAIKYLNTFSKTTCYILFVQAIAYYGLGHRISGKVPFLNYVDGLSSYTGMGYIASVYGQSLYRPTSLFAEPSHFSQFMIIPLAIALFRKGNMNLKMALITTGAILLTTSGQGIVLVGLLWLIWIFKYGKQNYKNINKLLYVLIMPLISILIVVILSKIPTIGLAITRSFSSSMGAYSVRVETGYVLFLNADSFSKLVGVGFGNFPPGIYISSAAYILYTAGVIGTIIVLLYYFDAYKNSNNETRAILIMMIILTFTSFYFFSLTATMAMAFVQAGYKIQNSKNKVI